MSRIVIIALSLIGLTATAHPSLDTFLKDAPKEIIVKDIQCSIDGEEIPPLHLDKIEIYQDKSNIWNIKWTVGPISAVTNLAADAGEYTFCSTCGYTHLILDMHRGSDFELLKTADEFSVSQIDQLPWGIRTCTYK